MKHTGFVKHDMVCIICGQVKGGLAKIKGIDHAKCAITILQNKTKKPTRAKKKYSKKTVNFLANFTK